MKRLETLSIIAHDLTAVLGAEDRYQRLLEAFRLAIPYDSAALLRLENDILVPIAAQGLQPTGSWAPIFAARTIHGSTSSAVPPNRKRLIKHLPHPFAVSVMC